MPEAQLHVAMDKKTEDSAFAALLEDGSLVTWGDPKRGGDSGEIQQLRDVQQIQVSSPEGGGSGQTGTGYVKWHVFVIQWFSSHLETEEEFWLLLGNGIASNYNSNAYDFS